MSATAACTLPATASISVIQDEEGPGPKRVKLACVACFRRKVRCTGAQPACSRCAERSLECVYNNDGNSRGGRGARKRPYDTPTPRIRSLEPSKEVGVGVAPASAAHGVVQYMENGQDGLADAPPAGTAVRQAFFRWFGPTSVVRPLRGARFRALSVYVREVDRSVPGSLRTVSQSPEPRLSLSRPTVVDAEKAANCVRLFYELFESYLPFTPLSEVLHQLSTGTMSEMVLLGMSAMVKRMRPELSGPSAEELADRAKALVISHLAFPSLDVVYVLVLLAYHEHGADRDSGLWAYSGMAIRMSIDLGLHKVLEPHIADRNALRSHVFWAVLCLDRILSCGSGRTTTIAVTQIEVDLPPPRDYLQNAEGAPLPDPFPYLCRLLLLVGQVTDDVNANILSNSEVNSQVLQGHQIKLRNYEDLLPPQLRFTIHTFSAYISASHAQVFLLMSMWHQALHLSIYEAAILFPWFNQLDGDMLSSLSASGAISMADMCRYADLIYPDAFLCTPVCSQPLFMAGRAALVLSNYVPGEDTAQQHDALQRSAKICRNVLVQIQGYWKGLSWHISSLDSTFNHQEDVDLSTEDVVIVTEDQGMVARARAEERVKGRLTDGTLSIPQISRVTSIGASALPGEASLQDANEPSLLEQEDTWENGKMFMGSNDLFEVISWDMQTEGLLLQGDSAALF